MASFKVGDRVEYASESNSVITTGDSATVVNIDRDGQYRIVMDNPSRHAELSGRSWSPVDFHWTVNAADLRPAAPRKDTPKAGDTVRVVLEGPASLVYPEFFHIGFNAVHVDSNHTVSIEILKPAKPSVKDLPAYAIVKNMDTGEVVRRRGRTDTWVSLDNLPEEFRTGEIDRTNWAHLVPQESE